MTDETRTRFLAAIAAQVPIERIAEVHLFPAIRQGGMESGVAVIAVERALEPTEAELAVGELAVGDPAVDELPVDESSGEEPMDALAVDEIEPDDLGLDEPPADDLVSDAVADAPVAARR